MSPYRMPPTRTPPRIETLGVRRYPLFIQVFIAVVFPVAAIVAAELYPDTSFTCRRASASGMVGCVLDESTALHHRRIVIPAVPNAVKVFDPGPDPLEIGRERFNVPLAQAREIKVEHEAFLHSEGPSLRVPIRSVRWLFAVAALAEVFVVAFYVLAQVRSRVRVDLDAGQLSLDRWQRFRRDPTRTIALSDVDAFRVDDLTEDARGFAVVARLRTGFDETLLTTVSGDAMRALRFLESAKARAA